MEVALPMLAEQLSQSAVEQRINNGYTGGCAAGDARDREGSSLLLLCYSAGSSAPLGRISAKIEKKFPRVSLNFVQR